MNVRVNSFLFHVGIFCVWHFSSSIRLNLVINLIAKDKCQYFPVLYFGRRNKSMIHWNQFIPQAVSDFYPEASSPFIHSYLKLYPSTHDAMECIFTSVCLFRFNDFSAIKRFIQRNQNSKLMLKTCDLYFFIKNIIKSTRSFLSFDTHDVKAAAI